MENRGGVLWAESREGSLGMGRKCEKKRWKIKEIQVRCESKLREGSEFKKNVSKGK